MIIWIIIVLFVLSFSFVGYQAMNWGSSQKILCVKMVDLYLYQVREWSLPIQWDFFWCCWLRSTFTSTICPYTHPHHPRFASLQQLCTDCRNFIIHAEFLLLLELGSTPNLCLEQGLLRNWSRSPLRILGHPLHDARKHYTARCGSKLVTLAWLRQGFRSANYC